MRFCLFNSFVPRIKVAHHTKILFHDLLFKIPYKKYDFPIEGVIRALSYFI